MHAIACVSMCKCLCVCVTVAAILHLASIPNTCTYTYAQKIPRTRFATVAVTHPLASCSTEGAKHTVYRARSSAARMI